ncbi:hypothetical protein BGW38_002338 [Lunasporangiospora selenospora]|uniref:DUF2421 domain-containing protein n=1 Tax=Lunasporangiospora selenospora TaxID=979761 RepID=A0A9P6FSI0_9FUNG|nr:hypothetical protein BGW38_002338 [Lunasporangiospora selenospora]
MTRADGSLGVDGHSDGSRPVTPLGSRQATPVSSRANSIHEERNSETVKSFKSLFSVKSSPRFKPKRTISLRAETKFGKGVKDSDDDPVGSPSAGVSYEELNAMTVPLPLRGDMLDHSLSHHRTHGGVRFGTPLTDQQVRKAAEAFRKQREKEVRRAHKRARREAKEEEDRIRKQQQAEEAARAVPPKEVAFGDRKLFISFLDIVRDPLQRLNDSCSRVMLAMERELVEGLNVEQDRLERIQRRNAQRTAAIRAAEATRLAEENKAAHATNAGAGCASTTATAAGEAADGAHGAAAAEPAKSKQLLDRLRGLMNLKSRHMSPEDIEYAEALKNDMEHEEKKKSKATKRGAMADTIHPNKFQQQTQRNAKSSGIDADDDDMALPLEMSYVQYLTQELEAFDKAEAKGLRDFISTHPTLDVGPREEIFLIFFFLFALREIARELLRLGKYMEEKQEDARRELEEKGSTKRSKRLWWPKVMGNFWNWIAWGNYTQVKTSEGNNALIRNSTKNLEHTQPRTVQEEKALVEAKAAMAAAKAKEEKKASIRRRRHSDTWSGPPLRRSVTLSTFFHRPGAHGHDLEKGEGGIHGVTPHHGAAAPIRSAMKHPKESRPMESTAGETRDTTPASPRRHRSFEPLPRGIRSRSTSQEGKRSKERHSGQDLADSSENRVQILKKGDHYTVAEIPSFESLQRKENQGQKRDFEGPLDVELLPRTNVIRYNTTAPAGLGITKKSSIKTPERTARRSSESHTREVLLSNLRGDPYLGQDGPRGPHGSDSTAVGHPSDLVRHVSYGSSRGGGDEKSETGSIDSKDDQDGYRSKGGKHRSKPKGGMLAVFGHRSSSEDSSDSMTRSGRKVTLAGEYSQPAPPPPPAPRTIFINVPKPKTLRYRIWEGLQKLKSEEVQFGFKMAVAMTFIGLWSWLNITSETFATDRGQWAMLTVIAVLSPTVGATFSVCAFRILGTILGTLWALLTYLALPRDPYVICAMMLVISFICVFLILEAGHPKLGIVTLLSYTSTTLLMYEGLTTETIYQVCYKRGVTVILGILISVVLQLLWPILARRELRKEIAILISREGVLFAELVSKFLLEDQPRDQQRHSKLHPYAKLYEEKESDLDDSDEYEDDDDISDQKGKRRYQPKQSGDPSHFRAELGFVEEAEAEELAKRDREQGRRRKEGKGRKQAKGKGSGSDNDDRDDDEEDRYWTVDRFRHQVEDASESSDPDRIAFQHVEHQLQTKLLKISQLLELSIAEPRLKEEFPKKLYGQIIQCCQNILDRLVSMRMAAQLLSPEVRELVTGPMNYYRRDMVGALLLYFSVLSSSLASKSPLPPYLPSARMARLRVIYNVREAIAAHQAATGEDHYTYIYYYAFSSALEEVIEELELLAILIKPLVGVTIVSAGTGNQGFGLTGEQLNIGAAMATSQLGILPMNTEYPPGMGQGYPEMSYGQQHAGLGPSLTGDRSALHGTSVHMTNVGTSQSGRGAGAFGTSANQLNEPVQTPGHPMETVHPYNLHKPIMSRSETAGRIPGVDFHPDLALHHPGILINPAIAPAGQKSVVSDAEPAKRRGSHHHHHDPSESNDSQHSDDGSGSWKSDRHSRHGHRRPQPAHSGEGSSSAPAPEDKMKKKDQSRPRRPSELRIDIPESSMDRAGLASAAAPASSKLIPRKKKMSLDATAAMAASPVIVMDENLLAGHRHAQRYMDAIQVAQEASGQKIVEMPSAMSPISSTAADGSGPGGIKPGITRTPTAPIVPAMIQLPMGASSTESATGGKRPVRERRTSANLIKSVGTGLFARRKSEILGEEEGNGAKMLHGGSKRRSIIRHLGHKSREDLPMAVIVSPPPEDQDLQDQKMEQEWLASSSRVPLKASAGSGSGTGMGMGVGTNTTATRAVGEGHAARSIPPMQSNTISIPAAVVIPFGSEFIPDAPLPLHLIPMQQQQQQASQEQTQTPDDVKHQETH